MPKCYYQLANYLQSGFGSFSEVLLSFIITNKSIATFYDMKISASINSKLNQHEIKVQTNDAAKEMHISPKTSGYGSSINGGELLLLSLATCFCNDIYREAAKRNIDISNVEVIFNGEFGGEGEPGANFTYKTTIISTAPESAIEDLIKHTDKIAEIHNTLRKGINITLLS